jgi:mannose-6-phosphate isomerase-like protein (cupin superfamily)
MKPIIKRSDAAAEYYFREGCFITELSNSTDDPGVSIARARVEPGITTHWHHLTGTVERYVILSGSGLVEIGDEPPRTVAAGDVIIIPALCRQRISNAGHDDLIFLAICSPRFLSENYRDIESET